MPGTLHQGILLLVQDDPWLAFDVLGVGRPCGGTPLDRRAEVERVGTEPWTVRQGYPDLVLVARNADNPKLGAVITAEAQARLDPDKRWMILVYQTHLAAEHGLETWSIVVSLSAPVSRAMRRWASEGPPRFEVLLLDADSVGREWLDAVGRPIAVVLAGILHALRGDLDAARQALDCALALRSPRARRHALTVLAALPEHQRQQLIEELPMEQQHDWIDLERRSGTYQFGHREGREQGRQALLSLLFEVIAERELTIDADQETRLRGCEDLARIRGWVRAAMHVDTVDELGLD